MLRFIKRVCDILVCRFRGHAPPVTDEAYCPAGITVDGLIQPDRIVLVSYCPRCQQVLAMQDKTR